jgi:hypothetical protein
MRFTIDNPPATSPHRPPVRAGVARRFNGYAVPGIAIVQAWPHRPMSHARAVARRIFADPASYLWAVRAFNVPGVILANAA